jgi:DNA-binding response OmpR family regulator
MGEDDGGPTPGPTILVADDEPHIRRILQTLLRAGGFRVDAVDDGSAARDRLVHGHPYDFVVLDIMMPGATGLEVLEQLRATERGARTPVVILTAKGQDADRDQAFALGADDFITKPFSPKKLLARIREILDTP